MFLFQRSASEYIKKYKKHLRLQHKPSNEDIGDFVRSVRRQEEEGLPDLDPVEDLRVVIERQRSPERREGEPQEECICKPALSFTELMEYMTTFSVLERVEKFHLKRCYCCERYHGNANITNIQESMIKIFKEIDEKRKDNFHVRCICCLMQHTVHI